MEAIWKSEALQSVAQVDVAKYLGKWYEIASYPQRFQKGCTCTSAEYTMSDKGYVIVENRCRKGSPDGELSYIKGKAFVVKDTGNAQLQVQFFWPFKAKYWIIDLADDYSYAVVSQPNRKTLWILSRTPTIDQKVYREILFRITARGFDIDKLHVTHQLSKAEPLKTQTQL